MVFGGGGGGDFCRYISLSLIITSVFNEWVIVPSIKNSSIQSQVINFIADPFSVHVEETLSEEEITVLKKTLEQPLLYNRTLVCSVRIGTSHVNDVMLLPVFKDKAVGCISTAVCLPTRDTVACMQHKPLAELHVSSLAFSNYMEMYPSHSRLSKD